MINIGIAGAGALGSRHLQALSNLNQSTDIFVYDPVKKATDNAKSLYDSIAEENKNKVNYYNDIGALKNDTSLFDLIIVATSASVRKSVIEELVANFKIDYFILEKVLFQKMNEYDIIDDVLNENHIQAWVNCPRRYFDIYSTIKHQLDSSDSFEMTVSGSNWGLGCNAIHFLDLLAFFTDDYDPVLSLNGLDSWYIKSKREGFLEVTGTITGSIGKCKSFSITSYSKGEIPVSITITADNMKYQIFESLGVGYVMNETTGHVFEKVDIKIPYQSNISNLETEEILTTGQSKLAGYKESMRLHKALISPLTEYFAKQGVKGDLCPIT